MKDPLFNSLAERFADHTMDVDPGTWSAISGQLAVASGSSLSGLFQEKFTGHEAPVDPQVWTNISSQLGHGAAAAGVGSAAGWWAAGIAATLVAGGVLVYSLTTEPAPADLAEKVPVVAPVITEEKSASQDQNAVFPIVPVEASASTGQEPRTTSAAKPRADIVKPAQQPENKGPEEITPAQPAQLDPKHPPPTPEGKETVQSALQNVGDLYMTSLDVLRTEPQIPAPTEAEMPSTEVRPQHGETEAEETEAVEPEMTPAVPAAALAVLIPTAFSPNNDGVNDELVVNVQNYQKATVRIFSASSNALVFSADNLEARWNGRVMNSGQPCEPGMYFYALEVTDAEGRTWSKGEVVRLFPR